MSAATRVITDQIPADAREQAAWLRSLADQIDRQAVTDDGQSFILGMWFYPAETPGGWCVQVVWDDAEQETPTP